MPSPFPGVDPYLEAHDLWEDVHARLANAISVQLQPRLRPRYFAALTPYVTYEDVAIEQISAIKPDIALLVREPLPIGAAAHESAAPYTAVSMIDWSDVAAKTQRIEIRAVGSNTLVTVIEILSPSNKQPGTDSYEAYQRKRRDVLHSDVHLLELDLLRRGTRWPFNTALPDAPYFAFLGRAGCHPLVEVWPITFREPPLPVAIPLRPPDPDIALDLGLALAEIYEQGAFELRIDYRQAPPPPALSPDESAWIDKVLHEAGLR